MMKKRLAYRTIALALIMLLGFGAGLASAVAAIAKPGIDTTLVNPNLDTGNITLVLLAPSDLDATKSSQSISLHWVDNSFNESGFEVERKSEGGSFIKVASTNANVTSYVDLSLAAGTYTFRVRAFNASQKSSYTNEVTVIQSSLVVKPDLTMPGDVVLTLLPTAPDSLVATALSSTEVKLGWADKSFNESGFKIERKVSTSSSFVEIATVQANDTAYEDTGLDNDTYYTYRVRAFNNQGNSAYTNEAPVLTPADVIPAGIKTIVYHIGQTTYYLNGTAYPMDAAPTIINGYTFIPIRYIAEPLGAYLTWDAALQTATFELGSTTVALQVGNNTAQVNGVATPIGSNPDNVPLIINGRLFVPLAFVAANLGCNVTWDGALQEITVTNPNN